jgi:hypothetical protein
MLASMSADHAVLVGPIKGEVTLSDGTVYDVSPDVVMCESREHAQEVADLVGDRYAAEGHPAHMYTGVEFKHDKAQSHRNYKAHEHFTLHGEHPSGYGEPREAK